MSTQTRVLLIAAVWACATVLLVLPSAWPAYMHLIGTRVYQGYGFEATGFLTGWLTKDVLSRRRRKQA